jgi:ubiquinone/menaquinone biosynthesis C-methylase UbiE
MLLPPCTPRGEEDAMWTIDDFELRTRSRGADVGHPVRDRLNAWTFRLLDRYQHRKLGDVKRELFGGLGRTVVEIGAGAGANLRYLDPGTRLVAIEPNRHMHPHLRAAAQQRGVRLELREASAEALPLPDASVSAVISSFVLCSVRDPAAVLAEIRRVLRPGERLWCLEHVRAPEGSALAAAQRALARPWRWFFEGCECRDLAPLLRAAGFASVEVTPFTIRTALLPVRSAIAAVAVR